MTPFPRILITCGPSSVPIDEVRRITNHSTGEIGTLLAEAATAAGFEAICLRGHGATFRAPAEGIAVKPFVTNQDLQQLLEAHAGPDVQAVFHAAALSDFELSPETNAPNSRKLSSRAGEITLRLLPAPKLITRLREFFPESAIVGWKYELDGGMEEAKAAGRRQLDESHTDAAVLNGAAYGPGFGILVPSGELHHVETKEALAAYLVQAFGLRAASAN